MLMFYFWVAQVAAFLWVILVFFLGCCLCLSGSSPSSYSCPFLSFFLGVVAGVQVARVIHVFVGLLLVLKLLLFFELQNNWSLTKN
jgi:hypothetical protein